MKRVLIWAFGAALAFAALIAAPVTALAASDDPIIVHAPQSYQWMEGASATYYCEVEGDPAKLFSYQWHIVYQGKDYLVREANGSNPWEAGAGSSYGQNADCCYFNGIGTQLDGAQIYCVVSHSNGTTTSPKATIMVKSGSFFFPPEIDAPVEVYCTVGEKVALTVKGHCRSGNVTETKDFITYEWMECQGTLETAMLIGWRTGDVPTGATYNPPTDKEGVYYYVCRVYDGQGSSMENESYSNVIKVTVQAASNAPSGSGSGGGNAVTVTTDPGSGGNAVTVTTDPGNQGTGNQGGQGSQGGNASVGVSIALLIAIIAGAVVLIGIIVAIIVIVSKGKK